VEAAFRRYVEQCPDAILVTDPAGRIVYANPAFERMTGYASGEIAGRTPALLKSGIHEADFYRRLWSALLAGQEFRALFANRRKSGEPYYEDKIIRPLFDHAGHTTHFISYGRDATERAREFDKLLHAATHDSLTDLPNRSLFLDRLGQALSHAARRDEPLTLGILDIDRFRDTNNYYGHLAGDAVLQAVGHARAAASRRPVPHRRRRARDPPRWHAGVSGRPGVRQNRGGKRRAACVRRPGDPPHGEPRRRRVPTPRAGR
jgi:PAS domain S-box-containing protein